MRTMEQDTPTENPIVSLMDIDTMELARQLTYIEEKMFFSIQPHELINQAWTRKDNSTPNVSKFIARFNDVSYWVQTEILVETRKKERAKIIEKFIDLAECLRTMNNLNGAFEIGSALSSAAIARLKMSFSSIPSTKLAIWEKTKALVDQRNLREAIRNATPPCIPYLGLYLTELTQIDEGNKSKTTEGLINMTKRKLFYRTISLIQSFQQASYNFKLSMDIQDYLAENLALVDDKLLFNFSMYVEPRNPNQPPEMPPELKELQAKKEAQLKLRKRPPLLRTKEKTKKKLERNFSEMERGSVAPFSPVHRDFVDVSFSEATAVLTQTFNTLRNNPDLLKNGKLADELFEETIKKLHARRKQVQIDLSVEIEKGKNRPANATVRGRPLVNRERTEVLSISTPRESFLGLFDSVVDFGPSFYTPTLVEWCWNGDKGGYVHYDTQITYYLEKEYQKDNKGTVKLNMGGKAYIISFENMTQLNTQTGFSRSIQRKMNWVKAEEHKKKMFELEEKIKKLEQQKEQQIMEQGEKTLSPASQGKKKT
uniref:Ras-GEF domain-containing protein n=1 Tax=Arcella intermedia TaxID=1963864 RepID=A0A6B2L1F7_9EUKA